MMNTEKLTKKQQEVMNEWPEGCEVCYFPKQGDSYREFVGCRDIKEKKALGYQYDAPHKNALFYMGGSTVKSLARKGAIKKVNSDPWFHVYHRA